MSTPKACHWATRLLNMSQITLCRVSTSLSEAQEIAMYLELETMREETGAQVTTLISAARIASVAPYIYSRQFLPQTSRKPEDLQRLSLWRLQLSAIQNKLSSDEPLLDLKPEARVLNDIAIWYLIDKSKDFADTHLALSRELQALERALSAAGFSAADWKAQFFALHREVELATRHCVQAYHWLLRQDFEIDIVTDWPT